MSVKLIISLLSLFFASNCLFGATAKDSITVNIEEYVEQVLKDWKIPGAALSVVHNDSLVLAEGFGMKELNKSTVKESSQVTENTIFQIGSISKSFTAALMAVLVDRGMLRWDDQVKDILPDFDWWDDSVEREIMVKDLFLHNTGLVAQVGTYIPNLDYDRDDIYRMFKYFKPYYGFREKFAYSNITFIIAARIIEKVTGKSWEENMQKEIFIPLKMSSSSLEEQGYLSAGTNSATAHDFRYIPAKGNRPPRMAVTPLRGEDRALNWLTVIGPAGGICSSAIDMSKWVQFHLDNGVVNKGRADSIRIISPDNISFLHTGNTFVRQDSTFSRYYGLCWYIENNDDYQVIYHTGTTWGFTAICGFVPSINLGIALLCNSEVSDNARFAIMRRIIDLYMLQEHNSAIARKSSKKPLIGMNAAALTLVRQLFPGDTSLPCTLWLPSSDYPTPTKRIADLRDWNAELLAKWWKDKEIPPRRAVPCTISRNKLVPDYSLLVGIYSKEAPFGDAQVALINGDLYITIGPKNKRHKLKHLSGNQFLFVSGGHTFPIYFHNYERWNKKPIDFEIDFNYNENFGPWTRQ